MNDELKKFSQAVLSGIQGGNTSAGTGNAIVDNFARSSFGDVLARPAAGVGNIAGEAADQEAKAAEAARQAKMQEIQDKLDPSKYRVARKEDGGFDFFDPAGNPIDVAKYAAVTGKTPAQILSQSDNPFDRQYVNDYNNTRDIVTAIQNGDSDTLNAFKAENSDIGKMTPEELMKQLIKKYPHIYGHGQYGDSYGQSNNKPLLRFNTGLSTSGGGAAGGDNYGFDF